jgi:hypothetical protein
MCISKKLSVTIMSNMWFIYFEYKMFETIRTTWFRSNADTATVSALLAHKSGRFIRLLLPTVFILLSVNGTLSKVMFFVEQIDYILDVSVVNK